MRGRVVRTPGDSRPYKVIFSAEQVLISEHPVSSVREGEALIRAKCDAPAFFQADAKREWREPDEGIMRLCLSTRAREIDAD